MLRVYLDQAKWIDFTKCRLGRDDGQRYQDALAVATEAVRLGNASFVLSSAHYFETHRRASWPSRLDLATTMAQLSQFHTIAPPHVVVPAEIDAALASNALGMSLNEFGVGFNHAFGGDIPLDRMMLRENVEVPPAVRSQLAGAFRYVMEFAILANPSVSANTEQVTLDAARKVQGADRKFADWETALGAQIDAHKLRARLGDVATATEVVDIMDPLIVGCLRNGIDPLEFVSERDRIQEFLKRGSSGIDVGPTGTCRTESPCGCGADRCWRGGSSRLHVGVKALRSAAVPEGRPTGGLVPYPPAAFGGSGKRRGRLPSPGGRRPEAMITPK